MWGALAPSFLALLVLVVENVDGSSNNMNPRPYVISNAHDDFSTEFHGEFFEVYSPPIKTLYSQVYWAMQDPVRLPQPIIERFENKVMAITGYEVDQVQQITNPDGTLHETSVPITWAYNHHYGAWLEHGSEKLAAEKRENYRDHSYQWSRGALQQEQGGFSTSEFFSEGNGGEFRSSFHGYPAGYAQLLFSPDTFSFCPMQIDTWNRTAMKQDTTAYHPGPLPKSSQIPSTAGYSGLIECPCSDRMTKEWAMTYGLLDEDDGASNSCKGGAIANKSECLVAAQQVVPSDHYHLEPDDSEDGDAVMKCSVKQHQDGSVDVLWKKSSATASTLRGSGVGAPTTPLVAFSSGVVNLTVTLDDQHASIRMTGPNDAWFGVAFGATSMCLHQQADECPGGGPYAIVVGASDRADNDDDIPVQERKLEEHGPGHVLDSSITVQWTKNEGSHHTVLLTRPLKGLTEEHFSFDPMQKTLDVVDARGCGRQFAQHCAHDSNKLFFVKADTETPICRTGIQGTIQGRPFDNDRCADPPTSDLKVQNNPTCTVQEYRGGLSCCHHMTSLLDKDQEIPWGNEFLEYHFKFRFYFEEYRPATATEPASHEHLTRFYFQTEAFAGEYDVPPCAAGTPPSQCVHTITSRFKLRQAVYFQEDDQNYKKATMGKLIYAGPHCHAPTCLSMDLYNADTGELLCRVEPSHGQTGQLYDEKGFLAIPPCLWGSPDEGLVEPKLLPLDTMLMSVKRNNNTLPHTGEMASWQMRGVLVTPPGSIEEESLDGKYENMEQFESVEEERSVIEGQQNVRRHPVNEPDA